MTIVFTKNDGSETSDAVDECVMVPPDYKNNANAIAFRLNCSIHTASDTLSPTIDVNDGVIECDLDSGTTSLTFTVDTTSVPGTFYVNDSAGTYSVILTISNVAP